MKYKKLLIFVTSLIFLVTLVVSFVTIFKVAEIELHVVEIENSNVELKESCVSVLENYKNKNLVFIKKSNVENELKSTSGYVKVVSLEKAYPNRLVISVEEREEAYTVKTGDKYAVLDKDFNVLAVKNENVNNLNKSNVEIKSDLSNYDESLLVVGGAFKFYDDSSTAILNTISPNIIIMRENLKSIFVNVKTDGQDNRFIRLTFVEGLEIEIDKVDEYTLEKLEKAFDYYNNSSNKGDIVKKYVTKLVTGEIVVL